MIEWLKHLKAKKEQSRRIIILLAKRNNASNQQIDISTHQHKQTSNHKMNKIKLSIQKNIFIKKYIYKLIDVM